MRKRMVKTYFNIAEANYISVVLGGGRGQGIQVWVLHLFYKENSKP
jgi:hypothetical protein